MPRDIRGLPRKEAGRRLQAVTHRYNHILFPRPLRWTGVCTVSDVPNRSRPCPWRHLDYNWLPSFGLRRSHLQGLLERHGRLGVPSPSKRNLAQQLSLVTSLGRLAPGQVLSAIIIVVRERLAGGVLAGILKQLQTPACISALPRYPTRLITAIKELGALALGSGSEARDPAALSALQHLARQLADHVDAFDVFALPVLCSLAQAAGPAAFRRLLEQEVEQLLSAAAFRAGIRDVGQDLTRAPVLATDAIVETTVIEALDASATVSPSPEPWLFALPTIECVSGDIEFAAAVAALYCAAARITRRGSPFLSSLSRLICRRIFELSTSDLMEVVAVLGRGDNNDDFVLTHEICRRSSERFDELTDSNLVVLLQAAAKVDLYDEEFLANVSERLRTGSASLPAARVADAVYSLGVLKVTDTVLVEPLCEAMIPKARELSEPDIVRFLRGLVRLRHTDANLMRSIEPEIGRQKWLLSPLSLGNIISALSLFTTIDAEFFQGLLQVATQRVNRLSSISVQHVLTGLCRQQGRISSETLKETLMAICNHVATPSLAGQLSPVQCVGALSALAKLRCRELPALSVILSAVVGQGSDVVWYWAPSANFYTRPDSSGSVIPGNAFDEARCLSRLRSELDPSHCVEILQGIHQLDLHGSLPLKLSRLVWEHLLEPQLHDLRAREIIAVARALGNTRIDVDSPGEIAWKENLVRVCVESLRRHEHYLESAWITLMPFQLLCVEIDCGAFGCRKLDEILNSMLLSFVDRLRCLTEDICERNRLLKETGQEDDGEITPPFPDVSTAQVAAGALGSGGGPRSCAEQGFVTPGALAHDFFPVDLLIQRTEAIA